MRQQDIRSRTSCLAVAAWIVVATTLAALIPVSTAVAQTPTFQPMMTGTRVNTAEYALGRVFAGTPKGGLIIWNTGSETAGRTLTRSDGLGGHFVTDLAWTDVNLWVATSDGGLTAISDPGGSNENLKVFSSLLSSLNVTAVTGLLVGDNERVFYGTGGSGIGEIVSGLPGSYYTTQDGLINDTVDAMALAADILLIATPVGVSRFADNTFTSYPYGDAEDEAIIALVVGPDGWIWSASPQGVQRWNDATRSWELVNANYPYDLAADDDAVWVLTWQNILRIEDDVTTTVSLPSAPSGYDRTTAALAAGDGGIWAGGRMRPIGLSSGSFAGAPWVAPGGSTATIIDPINSCQPGVEGGFDGAAVDSRGRPWVGDRNGDGMASLSAATWYNAVEAATVENDSNGFFDYGGGFLAMDRGGDAIWATQFTRGAMRFVPAAEPGGTESWLLLEPENSGMLGDGFLDLAVHPDGAVLFGTDNSAYGTSNNELLGVDVLFDPDRPRDPASWTHLYPDVVGGNIITAIGVERRDVIWFAVANGGLRRWDINGRQNGPDDPLTWADQRDDFWTGFQYVPGSDLDLAGTKAIVPGPDGAIFAGGSGLVEFTFDEVTLTPDLVDEWEVKESALQNGLLNQNVTGLAFDRNGALWVLTEGGLNRIRFSGTTETIDAYTDLTAYLDFYFTFYSSNIISALPGGTYRDLGVSADGSRLSISSDLGGATVSIPAGTTESSGESLASAYLYPNPFPGEDQANYLNLGGLDVGEESPLDVEVLNLIGQVIYRTTGLTSAEGFWDGRNRQDRPVASGLYIVKLTSGSQTATRTLAITY